MKYRHIHILAALFLIVGMAMQFVVAYRQVMRHQQENARLESDRKVMSHELQIAVKRYIGTAEPTDDITLMTISRKSGVRAQTND